MRFDKARIAMVAAALGAVLLPTTAFAGWFSSDTKTVTLEDVLKNAEEYKDETVTMTLYFNAVGDEFNPYYTQFHRAGYGNFSAWPMDARLYTKRDFQRCYPHFFVRRKSSAWKDVQKIDRFEAVEMTAKVTHVFKGRPYFDVLEIDTVGEGMDEDEIRAAIKAHAHFLAGHYDRAESLYRRALTSDVPPLVRADLNRRLGDVRFMAKEYSDAKSSYQRALRDAPDSELLKRNIAACEQAYGRRNGNQQAQIEPTRQIAHHLEPLTPDMHNSVDLIIAALEDPEKVREAETQDNLALARRSVHGTGDATAVTVSETKPDEGEKVAAAGMEQADDVDEAAEEAKAAEEARAADEAAAAKAAEEARAAEEAAAAKAAEEARAAEEAAAAKAAAEAKAAEEAAAAKAAEEAMAEEKTAEQKAAEDAANLEVPAVEPMPLDESNPRVFKVGNTLQLLPRLPFYGCATVNYEQFRAVVEEIMDTEDDLMVDGFESEMTEMTEESAEAAPEAETEEADDASDAVDEPEAPKADEPEADEPTIDDPWQSGDE